MLLICSVNLKSCVSYPFIKVQYVTHHIERYHCSCRKTWFRFTLVESQSISKYSPNFDFEISHILEDSILNFVGGKSKHFKKQLKFWFWDFTYFGVFTTSSCTKLQPEGFDVGTRVLRDRAKAPKLVIFEVHRAFLDP